MRLSLATVKVLRLLLEDRGEPWYGLALMDVTGLKSGAMYPILARLKAEGLVTMEREQVNPHTERRPVRIYCTLTPAGRRYAREVLTVLADQLRPPVDPDPRDPVVRAQISGN